MGDLGARLGAGDGRSARIREQIQNFYGAARASDEGRHEVPIDRLLGEKPRVFEAHRLDFEREITVADRPFVGHGLFIFPGTAAPVAALIDGVNLGIGEEIPLRLPDDLRIGAQKDDIFPPLQLIAVARGEDGIVFPVFRNFHRSDCALTTVSVVLSPTMSHSFVYPSAEPHAMPSARTIFAIPSLWLSKTFAAFPSAV